MRRSTIETFFMLYIVVEGSGDIFICYVTFTFLLVCNPPIMFHSISNSGSYTRMVYLWHPSLPLAPYF